MQTSARGFVSITTGCATQDGASSGHGPGGKADDGSEQAGLHVVAEVTELGTYNSIRWPRAVDDEGDEDDVINAALDFTAIAGESIDDIKARFAQDELGTGGVTNVDFTVNANLRGVLSLTLNVETMTAYPDQFSDYENFNSLSGEKVEITNLLDATKLSELAATLDAQLQTRIAETKEANRDAIASGEVEATQWDDLHVTVDDLSHFSTTADGITFHWSAGFPHVIKALEPDGELAVSMNDLDSYIAADGLWAEEY